MTLVAEVIHQAPQCTQFLFPLCRQVLMTGSVLVLHLHFFFLGFLSYDKFVDFVPIPGL